MAAITCPNCGTTVKTAHINIQQMVAVCPACDHIFRLEVPAPAAPVRKSPQPDGIQLTEGDGTLRLAFHTHFRLDQNQAFISSVSFSAVFGILTMLMGAGGLRSPFLLFAALAMLLLTGFFLYSMALIVANQTVITVDDDRLTVQRAPLPTLADVLNTQSLGDVVAFGMEETAISQEKHYDTPRYWVWAQGADGRRRLIVTDLVESYARFVAQALNEHHQTAAESRSLAHLTDDAPADAGDALLGADGELRQDAR